MRYQVCPVCGDRGIVPQGFYVYPAGQGFSSTSTSPEECRCCNGKGKILEPKDNRIDYGTTSTANYCYCGGAYSPDGGKCMVCGKPKQPSAL